MRGGFTIYDLRYTGWSCSQRANALKELHLVNPKS